MRAGRGISYDDALRERVMELWDQGKDTFDMAKATGAPEHECVRALHEGRERRRGKTDERMDRQR